MINTYINLIFTIGGIFIYNVFLLLMFKMLVQDDRFDNKALHKYLIYLSIFNTIVVMFVFQDSIRNFLS